MSPTQTRMSGVYEGSYDPVLSTYQSLRGPDMIYSHGDNQHHMPRWHLHPGASSHKDTPPRDHLISHAPAIGTSHGECPCRILLARRIQRLIIESYPVDSTLTTHPRHTPRSPQVITSFTSIKCLIHSQTILHQASHHRYNA